MHKIISILTFFLIHGLCFSQDETWEAVMDDTLKVRKSFDYLNRTKFNDSITQEYEYSPKFLPELKDWIIYYDKNKTRKLAEGFVKNNQSYQIQYFISGQKQREIIHEIPADYSKFQFNSWYENGIPKVQRTFSNARDTIIDRYFYPSGRLLERNLSLGSAWIYSERWCENGQIIFSGPVGSPDKRETITYHCNGEIKRKMYLMNGRALGKRQEWYDNGQLKMEGQYRDLTSEEMNNGAASGETGKWSYWNENGKLTKEEYYENGKLVKEVKY